MSRKQNELAELYALKDLVESKSRVAQQLQARHKERGNLERRITTDNVPMYPGLPYTEAFHEELEERIGRSLFLARVISAVFTGLVCALAFLHPELRCDVETALLNVILFVLYLSAYVTIRAADGKIAWVCIAAVTVLKLGAGILNGQAFSVALYILLLLLVVVNVFVFSDARIAFIIERVSERYEREANEEDDKMLEDYEVVKAGIIRSNRERYKAEVDFNESEISRLEREQAALNEAIQASGVIPDKFKNAVFIARIIDFIESEKADSVADVLANAEI